MSDGFMIDDGWMTDSAIHDLATWYHEQCTEPSQLTFEAHLSVMRTYAELIPGSPLDPAAGLSRARFTVLRLLYRAPDNRLLMGDFAEEMNVSPTNITKLMDTLVADGLVARITHEVDKRKTWAEITEAGKKVVESALPNVAEHVYRLWAGLDDEEKRALIHLLSKMRMSASTSDKQAAARAFLRQLATTG
jgi:MarR family transcriptional regulator, 2-MHQ and catechol-resistance regulon repressor